MSVKLALLLLKAGCAGWGVTTPSGDRIMLWACPPAMQAPAEPSQPAEEES